MFALGCLVARRIKRDGLLGSHWARGWVVAAVDGLEIRHSCRLGWPAFPERRAEHKVAGQTQTLVEYYHRLVMVVVVSGRWPMPLGVRFLQPGASEVACALSLLEDLVCELGRRYFDIPVADDLDSAGALRPALGAIGAALGDQTDEQLAGSGRHRRAPDDRAARSQRGAARVPTGLQVSARALLARGRS